LLIVLDSVVIASIYAYFVSLGISNPWPIEIFDGLFLSSCVLTSYAVLASRLRFGWRLFLVIFWSLTLRLGVQLRLAAMGVISNYPDSLYVHQLTMKIMSSGSIPPSSGLSGFAVNYVQFPGLEIWISSFSQISAIGNGIVSVFAAPFIATLGVLMLILVFKKVIGPLFAVASGLLASTFNEFGTNLVHGTLGLAFFGLLVFGILRGRKLPYILLTLVSVAAITISHDFTPVQVLLVLVFAWLFEIFSGGRRTSSIGISVLVLSVSYLAWVLFYEGTAFTVFSAILSTLVTSWFSSLQSTQLSLTAPPTIVYFPRMVSLVGLGGFLFLIAVGYCLFFLKRTEKTFRLIFPLCFGASAYFVIGSLPFTMSTEFGGYGNTVFPRSVEFLYLVGAPVAVMVLDRLSGRILEIRSLVSVKRISLKRVLSATLLLSIILIPTFFFFVEPSYYDMNAPLVSNDLRQPLTEWQTAGEWVNAHPPQTPVYGDSLGSTFIGAFGDQNVTYLLESSQIESLLSPHETMPVVTVLDRTSPAEQSIQPVDWQSIPLDNLVYSSSGVLIVSVVR
jgi:hypothetical protein